MITLSGHFCASLHVGHAKRIRPLLNYSNTSRSQDQNITVFKSQLDIKVSYSSYHNLPKSHGSRICGSSPAWLPDTEWGRAVGGQRWSSSSDWGHWSSLGQVPRRPRRQVHFDEFFSNFGIQPKLQAVNWTRKQVEVSGSLNFDHWRDGGRFKCFGGKIFMREKKKGGLTLW